MERLGRSLLKADGELSHRGAALIIALLVVTTYGVPLLFGRSLLPAPLGLYEPESRTPFGWPRQGCFPAADVFSLPQTESPWRKFLGDSLRGGEFPLWNPHQSLGVPFCAQYNPQIFLPLEWIEAFCSPAGWNLLLLLKLWFASFGAYLLMHDFLQRSFPALFSAMAFLFSGWFLWLFANAGFLCGAVLVPWILLGAWRCATATENKWRDAVWLALPVGASWLGGQPQISVLTCLGACVLFLVGAARPGGIREHAQRWLAFAGGNTLGLMLAAVQIGVFVKSLPYCYSLHPTDSHSTSKEAPLNLVNAVFPHAFGQLMQPWDPELFGAQLNWEGSPVVVGGVGLLLLSLAAVQLAASVLRRDKCRVPRSILALAFISLLILVPAFHDTFSTADDAWKRPFLTRVNVPRYSAPLLAMALAGLMGWAVDSLKQMGRLRFLLGATLALAILSWAGAAIVWTVTHAGAATDYGYMERSLWHAAAGCSVPLVGLLVVIACWRRGACSDLQGQAGVLLCGLAESSSFVRYGFDVQWESFRLVSVALLACGGVGLVWHQSWRLGGMLSGCAFAVSCVLMGTSDGATSLPGFDPHFALPPPHVEAIRCRGDHGRTLTSAGLLSPDEGCAYGLCEFNSLHTMQANTTADYMLKVLADRPIHGHAPCSWAGMESRPKHEAQFPSWCDYVERRAFYNAIGVRYLVDFPKGYLSRAGLDRLEPVYQDDKVVVYEDRLALPRAYATSSVVIVGDYVQAHKALTAQGMDPRTTPIVEAETPLLSRFVGVNQAALKPLAITHFGANRIDVRVDASQPCFVVLADAYFPGWTAYADGEKTPLYRVNAAVRGVMVPAGTQCVSFRYWPPYFSLFLGMSCLAALVCLVLWVVPCRRWGLSISSTPASPSVLSLDTAPSVRVPSGQS